MQGKVVHHGKYGYGVTWREDRFGRKSVKFESGKEVGGLSDADIRIVPKREFDDSHVLETLKRVGLDTHIHPEGSSDAVSETLLQDTEHMLHLFDSLTEAVVGMHSVPEIKSKAKQIVESADIDTFTKTKINKRLEKINEEDRIKSYLKNSMFRFQMEDRAQTLAKLNIQLNKVVEHLIGSK